MTVASYKSGLAWLWPSVAKCGPGVTGHAGHTTLQWAKQLFNQGQEFGVGPGLRLAVVDGNVAAPAKGPEIVEVEGFPAMLQRLEMVDLQTAGLPAGGTSPHIAVECLFPGPTPATPVDGLPVFATRQQRVGACVLCG